MIIGWYYLHTNGDLIYERGLDGTDADIRESDFARALWAIDLSDRECAWTICVEGLAAGALPSRVQELAAKWGCDDNDADIYAELLEIDLSLDGNKWCAKTQDFINIQESPVGFGPTKLEAFADLANAIGYEPRKMWGAGFREILKQRHTAHS